MIYLFPFLGIVFVTLGAVLAYKKRHNTSEFISLLLVGIFFSTVCMVLPSEWVKSGKEVTSPIAYSFVSSVLYSLKALGGRQDIAQIESLAAELPLVLGYVYTYLNYLSFLLAPLLTSSLLISFFGDFGEKMRFVFKASDKCHIISQLNNNSLALAEGIKKDNKKATIVFCNTKKSDKELIEKAKKLGAVTFYAPCQSFICGFMFKKYEFYLICENEDENIKAAEELTLKYKAKAKNITITAFVESNANVSILEQFAQNESCLLFNELTNETLDIAKAKNTKNIIFCNTAKADDELLGNAFNCGFNLFRNDYSNFRPYPEFAGNNFKLYNSGKFDDIYVKDNRFTFEWHRSPFRVRFIDEIALFCNNLVYEHPLYDIPDGRHDISVMIVGCGRLGMRMLKTAVWSGQVKDHTLKIRVYDKNASKVYNEFLKQCPELDKYDIKFIDADVNSYEFKNSVSESLDATYVTVATGNDELNLLTAEYLYRVFKRHNNFEYTPPIFTRVRTDVKSSNVSKSGFLPDRNIHIFGTSDSIFANCTVFNTKIENLGFALHLGYSNKKFETGILSDDYKKELHNYLSCEYARRSSISSALHIAAKLYSFGLIDKQSGKPTRDSAEALGRLINEDPRVLEELCKLEHDRWNAFIRSEGFESADFETVKLYAAKNGGKHKDNGTMLHPCLVEWDELDLLTENCRKAGIGNGDDFKKIDESIIKAIPDIIKYADSISEI